MKEVDTQVAEAMGYNVLTRVDTVLNQEYLVWWKDNTGLIADPCRWHPSTSYDQIIACIEAKGWTYVIDTTDVNCAAVYIFQDNDIVLGGERKLKTGATTQEIMCRAFLKACEAESR